MREISSNAGGVDDIVESQLVDVGGSLEKQRQWLEKGIMVSSWEENSNEWDNEAYLANATRSASNNCVKESERAQFMTVKRGRGAVIVPALTIVTEEKGESWNRVKSSEEDDDAQKLEETRGSQGESG